MWTLYIMDKIFSTYTYKEFCTLPEAVDMKNKVISEDPTGIKTEIIVGTCSMSFIQAIEKAGYSKV